MNDKVLNYEKAVKHLKQLELKQIKSKRDISKFGNKLFNKDDVKRGVAKRRVIINFVLSIIIAHKQARKLYGQLKHKTEKE